EFEEPTTATKTVFDFSNPPAPPMPQTAPPPPPPPPPPAEEQSEELFSPIPRQAVQRRTMSNIFPEPFSLPAHLKRDIPASAPSPLFASASQTSLKKGEEKKKVYHHRTNSLPVIPLENKENLSPEEKEQAERERAQNIKVQKVFSMWAAKTRPISPLFKTENSDTVATPKKMVDLEKVA